LLQSAFDLWHLKTKPTEIQIEEGEELEDLKTRVDLLKENYLAIKLQLQEMRENQEAAEKAKKEEYQIKFDKIQDWKHSHALSRLTCILKAKSIRSSFKLIKAAAYFNHHKRQVVAKLPKPRKKQWWERLLEE